MIDNESACMIRLPDESFVETREYLRFVEFCDATKKSKYIGVCYGPPGVGKTKSGRRYSNWDFQEVYLEQGMRKFLAPTEVREYDTLFFTPPVVHTAREIMKAIANLRKWLNIFIIQSYSSEEIIDTKPREDATQLIIIDEADRLSAQGFEYLRSVYDEQSISVIFLGMPGLEKRLSRYPQLYSRVGFVHEFKTLSPVEVRQILQSRLEELGSKYSKPGFMDPEAIAAIVRITHGNFRLLLRLLMQIERLMEINGMDTVSKELVEAAREILIIGIS
ncbi:AAA family ATPase [bacterium]|nr:AAA family ATPase [bacterium]MBP9810406.1 AAA family ATPase [bacterium]